MPGTVSWPEPRVPPARLQRAAAKLARLYRPRNLASEANQQTASQSESAKDRQASVGTGWGRVSARKERRCGAGVEAARQHSRHGNFSQESGDTRGYHHQTRRTTTSVHFSHSNLVTGCAYSVFNFGPQPLTTLPRRVSDWISRHNRHCSSGART